MFRYIQITQLATDTTFGVFLVSWFITRHILFLIVIKSTMFDAPKFIPFEWSVEKGRYLAWPAYLAFCAMLLALQVSPLFVFVFFFPPCQN
jgi:acyl-CoA-dependent ceramide synthase